MYSDCCFAVKKILWAKATINLESFWSGFVFIESCYFYCCHYRRCAITHHNLAASAAVIDGEGRIVWANFGQLTKVDTAREMWIITQQHIARTQKFQVSYFCPCKSNISVTTCANDLNGWKDESERRNIFVPSVGDQCIGRCLLKTKLCPEASKWSVAIAKFFKILPNCYNLLIYERWFCPIMIWY